MSMTQLVIVAVLYWFGVVVFFLWQMDFPTSKGEYMQEAHEANEEIGTPFSDKTILIVAFILVALCSLGWPVAVFTIPFVKANKE